MIFRGRRFVIRRPKSLIWSCIAPHVGSEKFMRRSILELSIIVVFLAAVAALPVGGQTGAALYQKGVALAKKNDFAGAVVKLEKAVRANPKYYEAYVALGSAQQQLQAYGAAADAFRQALALRPKAVEPHLLLGGLYQQLNSAANALTEYREALKLAPNSAEIHQSIGFVLAAINQLPEAIKEFEAAIRLRKNTAITRKLKTK